MKKEDILKAIFIETTNDNGKNRRYIAKSYNGGSGWGVYDMAIGKFLSKEITELNEKNFRELMIKE